ncbi:hypothetical protein D3C78_1480180 [compost metagenome]
MADGQLVVSLASCLLEAAQIGEALSQRGIIDERRAEEQGCRHFRVFRVREGAVYRISRNEEDVAGCGVIEGLVNKEGAFAAI